jgi:Gamma interferon inducible lysosomal thiol reductase (GILT)
MHGPEECAGNVQELCAAKYTPIDQWWEFVQCQNYQGRDKIGLPDVALKCAESAGIDWKQSGVGECAGLDGSGKGEEGVELLRQSIKSAHQLEIRYVNAVGVCFTAINRALQQKLQCCDQ